MLKFATLYSGGIVIEWNLQLHLQLKRQKNTRLLKRVGGKHRRRFDQTGNLWNFRLRDDQPRPWTLLYLRPKYVIFLPRLDLWNFPWQKQQEYMLYFKPVIETYLTFQTKMVTIYSLFLQYTRYTTIAARQESATTFLFGTLTFFILRFISYV